MLTVIAERRFMCVLACVCMDKAHAHGHCCKTIYVCAFI